MALPSSHTTALETSVSAVIRPRTCQPGGTSPLLSSTTSLPLPLHILIIRSLDGNAPPTRGQAPPPHRDLSGNTTSEAAPSVLSTLPHALKKHFQNCPGWKTKLRDTSWKGKAVMTNINSPLCYRHLASLTWEGPQQALTRETGGPTLPKLYLTTKAFFSFSFFE